MYLDGGNKEIPFNITKNLVQAPVDEHEQAAAELKQKQEAEGGLNMNEEKDAKTKAQQQQQNSAGTSNPAKSAQQSNQYIELFNSIPELKELGSIFKSCAPVELTETETEYVVTCIKHILPSMWCFNFN